jgi:hypothetical protein
MRLPPNVHLFRVTSDRYPAEIPLFIRVVPMPNIPEGTTIPPNVVACEFLPGVQRPLPEGTILAPGVKVLSTESEELIGTSGGVPKAQSTREDASVVASLPSINRGPSIARLKRQTTFTRQTAPATATAAATMAAANNRRRSSATIQSAADIDAEVTKDCDGRLLLPVHACLVERLPGSTLPPTVTKGSRSSLPSGVLLGENVEIVVLPVRFEVPPGVTLAPGAILGPCTQLAPGTIIARDLEVVEWSQGMQLPQGIELVRLLPGCDIMPVGVLPVSMSPQDATQLNLPPDCMMIKLPDALPLSTSQQLAENVEVSSVKDFILELREQLKQLKTTRKEAGDVALLQKLIDVIRALERAFAQEKVLLPLGAVLVKRKHFFSQLPAEMTVIPDSALPFQMRSALEVHQDCILSKEVDDER